MVRPDIGVVFGGLVDDVEHCLLLQTALQTILVTALLIRIAADDYAALRVLLVLLQDRYLLHEVVVLEVLLTFD